MKCLLILSLGFDQSGPSIHLLTSLIEGLCQKGHFVHVIEEHHANASGSDLPDRLKGTGRVTYDALPVVAQPKNSFAARYLEKYRYARRTAPLIKAHADADIVYVHSCNTLGTFQRLSRKYLPRAPLVLNVQDIFPENSLAAGILTKSHPAYKVLAFLQHRAYRAADAIVTLSEDMKKTLVSLGANPAKVHVISLWSYADDMPMIEDVDNLFLQKFPAETGVFRAVYAGNVGTMQNVELILRAALLVKDRPGIRFLIVGNGARLLASQRFAAENALHNVHFYPMQPPEMAPHIYAMAHVNLITLAPGVIYTAFPSKTTTCCAMARPIIACVDAGSDYARMIAACDHCAVCDCTDAQALAAHILQCAQASLGGARTTSAGARALYQGQLSACLGIAQHTALFECLTSKEAER
ncbi:MAG: glycosyltransferase family 4 protein [Clostridia bacterium]